MTCACARLVTQVYGSIPAESQPTPNRKTALVRYDYKIDVTVANGDCSSAMAAVPNQPSLFCQKAKSRRRSTFGADRGMEA